MSFYLVFWAFIIISISLVSSHMIMYVQDFMSLSKILVCNFSIKKFITQDDYIQLVILYENCYVQVLIFNKQKFQSVYKDLICLHWLKIESKIAFKAVLLIFKYLEGTSLDSLIESLMIKIIDPLSIHYRKYYWSSYFCAWS